MTRNLLAALLIGGAFSVPIAFAADDAAGAFAGEWHWNKGESSVIPGEPLPREVVLRIASATPARVQWTLTRTDADGSPHTESFAGSGGGQPGPITGAPDTTGAFTVTVSTLDASYQSKDGSTDRTSCTLSSDRRKMTCRGTESDGKGHSMNYVDVYDRR
jgi:hypothetical protein